MPLPTGLQSWEILALSAICAVGYLTIASLIGAGIACWVYRERAVATYPAPTASPEATRSENRAPGYA